MEEQKNPKNNEEIYSLLRRGIRTGDSEAALMLGRLVLNDAVNHHSISKSRAIKIICAVSNCAPSKTTRGIANYILGDFSLRSSDLKSKQHEAKLFFGNSAQLGCIPALYELAKINALEGRRFKTFFFLFRWALLMGCAEFLPAMRGRLMTA